MMAALRAARRERVSSSERAITWLICAVSRLEREGGWTDGKDVDALREAFDAAEVGLADPDFVFVVDFGASVGRWVGEVGVGGRITERRGALEGFGVEEVDGEVEVRIVSAVRTVEDLVLLGQDSVSASVSSKGRRKCIPP